MYIAGRLRTASRPSKTVIWSAPYSVFALANFYNLFIKILADPGLYFSTCGPKIGEVSMCKISRLDQKDIVPDFGK
jgi:hypothetical protein